MCPCLHARQASLLAAHVEAQACVSSQCRAMLLQWGLGLTQLPAQRCLLQLGVRLAPTCCSWLLTIRSLLAGLLSC